MDKRCRLELDAWPTYEPAGRRTMIFAAASHATADPEKSFREF